MPDKRIVYFVSDRTGITAEALGKSLLTQFDHIEFERHTLPFIDTPKRAAAAVDWINRSMQENGRRPIVFSTLMDQELRAVVASANALFIDFFATFITPLEAELGIKSSGAVGKAHGIGNNYLSRMNAVNFTLSHDDGLGRHLDQADIILTGVSRCGKTPTCLYLALQNGLYAANYPLTPEDFEQDALPAPLSPFKAKLFGLSISPERLAQIRQERKPDSDYARLSNCRTEIRQAEILFKTHGIPFIDSSAMSIEEIASSILHQTGLTPR
ncbi:MAG: posphoenolpyruvate synthetase regulatory kinase/phosphorylase PpsR [Burkholderiales bacterium]